MTFGLLQTTTLSGGLSVAEKAPGPSVAQCCICWDCSTALAVRWLEDLVEPSEKARGPGEMNGHVQ